jgi:hypothetical protein
MCYRPLLQGTRASVPVVSVDVLLGSRAVVARLPLLGNPRCSHASLLGGFALEPVLHLRRCLQSSASDAVLRGLHWILQITLGSKWLLTERVLPSRHRRMAEINGSFTACRPCRAGA